MTASGKCLPELVIFKGKKEGRIARNELPFLAEQYGLPGAHYTVQAKFWMDEEVMYLWIREVLQPYLAGAPPDVHPVLFLDSYRCHTMAPIVKSIQGLGCQVEHIPPGCTPLCQPIDIGVCKPLKDRMKSSCDDFIFGQYEAGRTKFNSPSRGELATWIYQALHDISSNTIRNSWSYGEYGYYYLPIKRSALK